MAASWSVIGSLGDLARLHQRVEREPERDPASGDRGAARAAVGLEDVAVHVDAPLAERVQIDDRAKRAADQALDLDPAPVLAALAGIALLALAGGRRKHRVLGCDPAPATALHPARNLVGDRRRADHARLALRIEGRAGRRPHEARLDLDRAGLMRGTVVAADGHCASLPDGAHGSRMIWLSR